MQAQNLASLRLSPNIEERIAVQFYPRPPRMARTRGRSSKGALRVFEVDLESWARGQNPRRRKGRPKTPRRVDKTRVRMYPLEGDRRVGRHYGEVDFENMAGPSGVQHAESEHSDVGADYGLDLGACTDEQIKKQPPPKSKRRRERGVVSSTDHVVRLPLSCALGSTSGVDRLP